MEVTPNNLTAVSAYVQQDDLFIGTLTVKEHLTFQVVRHFLVCAILCCVARLWASVPSLLLSPIYLWHECNLLMQYFVSLCRRWCGWIVTYQVIRE